MRRAVAIAMMAVLVAGCRPDQNEDIADLQAIFPLLEQHQVVDFIWTDGCEFIKYERGSFSTDPDSDDCELHIDTPGERQPIDDETRKVLDELRHQSEAVGPRLHSATVDFVGGKIGSGYFDFGQSAYYRFDPGYSSTEDDDFCSTERINADWYVQECGVFGF